MNAVRRFCLFFMVVAMLSSVGAQTLCTKFSVIKEIVQTEKKQVLVQAAVFETRWTSICTKEGFWSVEYKDNLPCKIWNAPEYTQVLEQVETKPAIYKDIDLLKRVRDAEITAYLSSN
jgi:hypothetical protein